MTVNNYITVARNNSLTRAFMGNDGESTPVKQLMCDGECDIVMNCVAGGHWGEPGDLVISWGADDKIKRIAQVGSVVREYVQVPPSQANSVFLVATCRKTGYVRFVSDMLSPTPFADVFHQTKVINFYASNKIDVIIHKGFIARTIEAFIESWSESYDFSTVWSYWLDK